MISSRLKQYISYSLNALTGVVFILSAVLKLLSVDTFELYIYSFQILNLNLSAVAARLIISAELILGIGLIINLYPKFFRLISIAVLSVFSLFLIYLIVTQGNNDNCHCFGDLVELNPLPSLLKNLLIIGFLLFSKCITPFNIPFKKAISALLIVAPIITVFTINPPDNWLYSQNKADYNETAFFEFIDEEQIDSDISNDPKIFCFFGVGCQYCEMAAKKLYLIQQNNPEVTMDIIGVFWGKEEKLNTFKAETELTYSQIYLIDPVKFLRITNGEMPVILILKNREILRGFNYRNLQEKTLINILDIK